MMVGFHMNLGYKTIIIEDVDVCDYKFHFCIDDIVYDTKTTDDKRRYISALSRDYHFEKVDNPEYCFEILRRCTGEVFRCSES